MANLEKLIADHAYWSDKRRELKELGCIEISKCNGTERKLLNQDTFIECYVGPTCIEHVFELYRELQSNSYDEYITYDDVWDGAHDEEDADGNPWEPCEHCKKTRELKRERMIAGQRLGQIRGTMTKIGRSLQKEGGR